MSHSADTPQAPISSLPEGLSTRIREAANSDHASVVDLIQRLVQLPSRGGLDSYEPVLNLVASWLTERGLRPRHLHDEATGETVALVCDVPGNRPGPRYVLDACVDTAPFGDESLWRYQPTGGVVEDGWLYGRGAADSKAGLAIFAHVAARLAGHTDGLCGTLTLLFDADEHTGRFGGAKRYFGGPDAPGDVAGVMIGYPGMDNLVIGGRGFLRAQLIVRGEAGHTGGSRRAGAQNAIEKAAAFINRLTDHTQPAETDPVLELPPRATVTAVQGGEGYSIVPDRCVINVDIRLTTTFDRTTATTLLQRTVTDLDQQRPGPATEIVWEESWPAYRLEPSVPVRAALAQAAERQLPHPPIARVAGPSNIGNYLAKLAIPATPGIGVRYDAVHGTNEGIELATIPAVQATYHEATLTLLNTGSDGD